MGYRVIHPEELVWESRPSEPDEAQRHTAEPDDELLLYAHGWPPERERAEILESAV